MHATSAFAFSYLPRIHQQILLIWTPNFLRTTQAEELLRWCCSPAVQAQFDALEQALMALIPPAAPVALQHQ
jgi:hypothetical protein